MSTIQTLVKLQNKDDKTIEVTMPSPRSITANRGIGLVTGDSDITWETDLSAYMPDWADTARVYVYAARGHDINTNEKDDLLNIYYAESVEPKMDSGGYVWRLRGRDASQSLLNVRITESYSETEKYSVGDRTIDGEPYYDYPDSSVIIKNILASYFTGSSEGAVEVKATGVKSQKNDGSAFPIKGYTCDNKSFGDVLLELSSHEYTQDGAYIFSIHVDIASAKAFLIWEPIASTEPIISSNLNTGTACFTISASNTRYAQKFLTGTQYTFSKQRVSEVQYYQRPGGTLQGYWTLEVDSAGSPSGTALATTSTVTLNVGAPTVTRFISAASVNNATNYWLVFYRTAGTGSFYGSSTFGHGSNRCKRYSGAAWLTDINVYDMYYVVSGIASNIYWREGHSDVTNTEFISIEPGKAHQGVVNLVVVNCGNNQNGYPIMIHRADPNASFAYGLKTSILYREEIAKDWLKKNKEPDDYPETIDGTTVENWSDYVDALEAHCYIVGWNVAGLELRKLSRSNRAKWKINATVRGTNDCYVGQGVTVWLTKVRLNNDQASRNYYIDGIQHKIDTNGWVTTFSLIEQEPTLYGAKV